MKKSIFLELMGSLLIFILLVCFSFAASVYIEATGLGAGDISNIQPNNMIADDGTICHEDVLHRLGGWIEEIDDQNVIVNVYGNKKTENRQYSGEQLLDLISIYGEGAYIGFLCIAKNTGQRFLCIYERNVMQPNINVIVNHLEDESFPPFGLFRFFIPMLLVDILLISLYLRRKIKKPLQELVQGMERLQAGEDSARLNIKTEAEFEEIMNTFNMMADQLEHTKNAKNQLLLELSHDIKTPVATIKSCANALEAGLVPREKVQSYYHTIDAKADRICLLADDMFTMLKMEHPDYQMQKEKVDICEYLRQACAEYYDEIQEAGFAFEIAIPEQAIFVSIDKALFARLLGNLLNNAEKYNETGHCIGLRVWEKKENEEAASKVSIEVTDDGAAIATELVNLMFTPFIRGDCARKTDGGTGLGLAISRLIAQKHEAELIYLREKERNCFRIELCSMVNMHLVRKRS